jgi:hypothetical protein
MTADAEFSGETPAPRPAGERAAEEIVQGLCNCQGAEQAGHRDGCLTRRIAAALTHAHEAARREELHDDDCSLGKHGHPYEAVCDCGRDRREGLCPGCHGNGTITIRESGSNRAIGVSVCPACNGRGEIADPPLTPTGKLARALTEERRMRVQLSDDSQRHLDRALVAERERDEAINYGRDGWRKAEELNDALGLARTTLEMEATLSHQQLEVIQGLRADLALAREALRALVSHIEGAYDGEIDYMERTLPDEHPWRAARALLAPPEGDALG